MPALIPLAVAGVSAAASAWGAHKQTSSADKAANLTTQAANNSANLQAQASRDALKYQQEQAARDQANFEQTQRLNYDQWSAGTQNTYNAGVAHDQNTYDQYVSTLQNDRNTALANGHNAYGVFSAKEKRMGTLGQLIGMGERDIPAWEDPKALVIPKFTKPEFSIPGYGGGGPAAGGNPNDPGLLKAMADANARYGFEKHTDPGYWAAMYAKDPEYTKRRLMGEGAGPGDAPGYQTTANTLLH